MFAPNLRWNASRMSMFRERKRKFKKLRNRQMLLEKLEGRDYPGAALPVPATMLLDVLNSSQVPTEREKSLDLFRTAVGMQRDLCIGLPKQLFDNSASNPESIGSASSGIDSSNLLDAFGATGLQDQVVAGGIGGVLTDDRFDSLKASGQPIIIDGGYSFGGTVSNEAVLSTTLISSLSVWDQAAEGGADSASSTVLSGADGSGNGPSGGGASASGEGVSNGLINNNPQSQDASPMGALATSESGGGGGGGGSGNGLNANTDSDQIDSSSTALVDSNGLPLGSNDTDSNDGNTATVAPTNDPPNSATTDPTESIFNVPQYSQTLFQSVRKVLVNDGGSQSLYISGAFQISGNPRGVYSVQATSRSDDSVISESSVTATDGLGRFDLHVAKGFDDANVRLVDTFGAVLVQSTNVTPATNALDSDNDGVVDIIERSSAGTQDRNFDGIEDFRQNSVATTVAAHDGTATYLTLDGKGNAITDARVDSVPNLPDSIAAPYGMIDFKITGLEVGASTSVDLYVPNPSLITSFTKYDPLTEQTSSFDFDGQTGAIFNGDRITLYFVDGGRGDADGIANGVIHDPFIPGGTALDVGPLLSGTTNLSNWSLIESGGTAGSLGTVTSVGNDVLIEEKSSYIVGIKKTINLGATPNILRFRYEPVQFDYTATGQIKDAFEVGLLDANGIPLVSTFVQPNRDAYVNVSEGVSINPVSLKENASRGSGTYEASISNDTIRIVDLDVSNLAGNSLVTLFFRLTNNDGDQGTKIKIKGGTTPPTVVLNGSSTTNEGSPYVLNLASSYAGSEPITGWNINWGDGTSVQNIVGNPATVTRTYPDDDPATTRTITATALTASGATGSGSKVIVVSNVAPSIAAIVNIAALSGVSTSFPLGSFTDPGFSSGVTTETFTAKINWGDSPTDEMFTPSSVTNGSSGIATSATLGARVHTYASPGTYNAVVTVTDDDGGVSTSTFTVNVTTASISFPAITGQEGSSGSISTLNANVTGLIANATYTYEILWGNNPTATTGTISGTGTSRTFTATTRYADNGSFSGTGVYSNSGAYTVTTRVRNSANTIVSTTIGSSTISNVAPSSPGNGTDTAVANTSKSFALGTFTDPGFRFNTPGSAWGSDETYTATINWGDNSAVESVTPTIVQGTTATLTQIQLGSKSHTYTSSGTFTAIITVTDDDGGTVTRNLTVTVSGPSVTFTNLVGTEAQALTLSATASNLVSGTSYTYEILWGNNTTSTGSITGTGTTRTFSATQTSTQVYRDNGSFSPTGVYSSTGSYAITVRVKQGATVTAQRIGTATISNTAPTAPVNTSQSVVGQASTSFVLATTAAPFSDPGFSAGTLGTAWASAESFTASINWGDGTSNQSVTPSVTNGAFGTTTKITLPDTSHVYQDAGVYTLAITVTDDEGLSATKTITVTVTGIAISFSNLSGNEGSSGTAPTLAANVTGLVASTAYTYEVLWGDNQITTGSFTPPSTTYTINETHRYADNGSFSATGVYSTTGSYVVEVRVKQGATLKASQSGTATIANVAPTAPTALTASVSTLVNNTIALGTFTDPGFSIGTVGQAWGSGETFTASIAWSDGLYGQSITPTVTNGSTSTATSINLGNQVRSFSTPGTYTGTITVSDDNGGTVTRLLNITVVASTVSINNVSGNEGASLTLNGTANQLDLNTAYTAVIDWGDGSTTTTVTLPAGTASRAISSPHTYPDNKSYTVSVQLKFGTTTAATTTATVTIANVAPSNPVNLVAANPTNAMTGQDILYALGSFIDPGTTYTPATVVETITGTVNWGDSTPVETLTFSGLSIGIPGNNTVANINSLSHRFAQAGTYPVTVTLTDDDGGTSNSVFTVMVTQPTVSFNDFTGPEGATYSLAATISGTNTSLVYTGEIIWGNGAVVSATPVLSGQNWTISASNTYQDNGVFPVKVSLKLNGNVVASKVGSATVQNVAPVLSPLNTIRINPSQQPANQRRTISISPTFTDVGVLDTHTASINWGDGTASDSTPIIVEPGTNQTTNPGTLTKSHQYASNGVYTVTVTLSDDDGGTHTRTFGVEIDNTIADVVPIPSESILELDLSAVNALAGYNNELGFYVVQDASGLVGGKYPGESGYAAAAINAGSRHVIMPKDWVQVFKETPDGSKPTRKYTARVDAGSFISFYAIQNNTTDWWVSNNASNIYSSGQNVAFFTTRDANPESGNPKAVHFNATVENDGRIRYDLEDLRRDQSGYDGDFNDLSFKLKITPVVSATTTKFFVANDGATTDEVYTYAADGSPLLLPTTANAANSQSIGATSDYTGTKLWILDANKNVYRYGYTQSATTQSQTLESTWTPKTSSGAALVAPTDIATNGTDIWVVDKNGSSSKIYRYPNAANSANGSAGNINANSTVFSLDSTNSNPIGLAVDATRIFVTNFDSTTNKSKMYVYSRSTGTLTTNWSLDPGNGNATDVTTEPTGPDTFGTNLWVVDKKSRDVYQYINSVGWLGNGTRNKQGATVSASFRQSSVAFALTMKRLASGDTVTLNANAEGIADPPPSIQAWATGNLLPVGTPVLVSGTTDPGSIVSVASAVPTIIDSAGNFFYSTNVVDNSKAIAITSSNATETSSTFVTIQGNADYDPAVDLVPNTLTSLNVAPLYQTTSTQAARTKLFTDLQIQSNGKYPLSGPLWLGVRNISRSDVTLANATGYAKDRIPYIDVSKFAVGGKLSPGAVSNLFRLEFNNPSMQKFTYELVLFTKPNQAPAFTTVPVVAARPNGVTYAYNSNAIDPEGDGLTYSLLEGPSGLSINSASGAIAWTTAAGNSSAGQHRVAIQVKDPSGLFDIQRFTISVPDTSAINRPPVWTSTPVTESSVGTAYSYPSNARDPDADTLTYTKVAGPAGLGVNSATGQVYWIPSDADYGVATVTLRASDNGLPNLFADHTFKINVGNQPANRPPVIVSTPKITQGLTTAQTSTSAGNVTPTSTIVTGLSEGQSSTHAVTYTRSPSLPKADVLLLLDDTGSMAESWSPIVGDIKTAFGNLASTYSSTDFAFGVSRFGDYVGGADFRLQRPYTLNQPLYRTSDAGFDRFFEQALYRTQNDGGPQDAPESSIEALFQAATGAGLEAGRTSDAFYSNPNNSPFDSGYASEINNQSGIVFNTRDKLNLHLKGVSGDVPPANATRDFSYRLLRVSDMASLLITPGATPIYNAGEISLGKGAQAWRFSTTATNQVLRVPGNSNLKDARWNVYDTQGLKILEIAANVPFRKDLSSIGEYVLVLDSQIDAPISYKFAAYVDNQTTPSIAFNNEMSGVIDSAKQIDRYQFTLTNTTGIYFDVRSPAPGLKYVLRGPDGKQIESQTFSNSTGYSPEYGSYFYQVTPFASDKIYQLASGDYSLEISSVSYPNEVNWPLTQQTPDSLASYRFALLTTGSGGTPVAFNSTTGATVNHSVTTSASAQVYSFTTTSAGQTVTINNPTLGGLYKLELVDTFGRVIYEKNTYDQGNTSATNTFTLREPGNYQLIFDGSIEASDIPFSSTIVINGGAVVAPSTPTTATLGTKYSGTLAPFQTIEYSLDLSANTSTKQFYFDSMQSSDVQWTLYAPSGQILAQNYLNGSQTYTGGQGNDPALLSDQFQTLNPGKYRFTLSELNGASEEGSGDYAFRVLDLNASVLSNVTPDTTTTANNTSTNPGNGAKVFALGVSSTLDAYFDGVTGNATWRTVAPNGSVVINGTGSSVLPVDAGMKNLAWLGTYYVVLDGSPSNTSTSGVAGAFNVIPKTISTSALALQTVNNSTTGNTFTSVALPNPAAQGDYTFTLAKPTNIYFEPSASSYSSGLLWTLTGTSGRIVDSKTFSSSASKQSLTVQSSGPTGIAPNPNVQWLSEGTYTVSVTRTENGPTSGEFRVVDLGTSGTSLVNDTALNQTSGASPAGTRFFTWDGRRGDYLQFDFSETGTWGENPAPDFRLNVRIYDPHGVQIREGFINPETTDSGGGTNYNTNLTQAIQWKFDLESTGRYTITIEDRFGGDISNNFTIKRKTLSSFPASVTNNQSFNTLQKTTINPEKILYDTTYNVSSGDRFIFDGLTSTGTYPSELMLPSGVGYRLLGNSSSNSGMIKSNASQSLLLETYSNSVPYSYGRSGGAGFRSDSIPIIILATDNWSAYRPESPQPTSYVGYGGSSVPADHITARNPVTGDPRVLPGFPVASWTREESLPNAAQIQTTIAALNKLGAFVIPVFLDVTDPAASTTDLAIQKSYYDYPQALARLSGAINGSSSTIPSGDTEFPIAPGMPLSFFFPQDSDPYNPAPNTVLASQLSTAVNQLLVNGLMDVDVIPSDPSVTFENLTGPINDVDNGQTASFNVRLTGDGSPKNFDFLFVRKGTGNILGRIPAQITNNQPYGYDVDGIDPDQDVLSYSLVGPNNGATINTSTGVINWNPSAAGKYDFTVSVSDGHGGRDSQSWSVTVGPDGSILPNKSPVLTAIPSLVATTSTPFAYQTVASDEDRDPLLYLLEPAVLGGSLPSGLGIHPKTGELTWTPTVVQVGSISARVKVIDGRGGVSTQPVTINVSVAQPVLNSPPVILSIADATIETDKEYRFKIVASDPQNDPIQFRLSVGGERFAVIDPITDTFVWTPRLQDIGSVDMVVAAFDNNGGVGTRSFTMNVVTPNRPPIFKNVETPTIARRGSFVTLDFSAIDPDGDAVTYSLGLQPDALGIPTLTPTNATIDPSTGRFSWYANSGSNDPIKVVVVADDGRGGKTNFNWQFVLTNDAIVNHVPYFTTTPRTILQPGVRWSYRPEAFDQDAQLIGFNFGDSMGGGFTEGMLPDGMTFNQTTRTLSWIPRIDQLGTTQQIYVGVTDGQMGDYVDVPQVFRLTVVASEKNDPPKITSSPSSSIIPVSQQWSYAVKSTDPDNDPVQYALLGNPVGMFIDKQTGLIQWSPSTQQVGMQSVIVEVTDPYGGGDRQSISLDVRSTDLPPIITSDPVISAIAGTTYTYALTARDLQGRPLFYSLSSTAGAAATISNTGSSTGLVSWNVPASSTTTQSFQVLVSTGPGTLEAKQSWSVGVGASLPDRPPVITSTPKYSADIGQNYTYQVLASDPDGTTAFTYSLATIPSNTPPGATAMTISGTGLVTWTPVAGHLTPGVESFEVVVTSNGKTARQRIPLAIKPTNNEPVLTTPQNLTITPNQLYAQDLKVTDLDNDPIRYVLSGTNLPAGLSLDQNGRLRWQSSITTPTGVYNLNVLATDDRGQLESAVTMTITVAADTTGPVVNMSSSPTIPLVGKPLKIDIDAIDPSGIAGYSITWSSDTNYYGSELKVDPQGVAYFTPTVAEPHSFSLRATDGAGNVTTIFRQINVGDNSGAPVVAITSPVEGSSVGSIANVIGSVSDTDLQSWTLSALDKSGTVLRILGTGTTTKSVGSVLGAIDATSLPSELVTLVLSAVDNIGQTASVSRNVSLASLLKLGNFNIGFTDLTTNAGGLPITISRSYDSAKAAQNEGDFGPGWSLQWSSVSSQLVDGTTGGLGNGSFPGFINGTRVLITLPDGRVEGFTFQATVTGGSAFSGYILQPRFVPDAGNTSLLGVSQMKLTDAFKDGSEYWTEYGQTYNPQDLTQRSEYMLQTADGKRYSINPATGAMKSVIDNNGNTLTRDDSGIYSNRGRSLSFTRDQRGNITRITDPRGGYLEYQYDPMSGRLTGFRDRMQSWNKANNIEDKQTSYTYLTLKGYENYLSTVIDPNGQVAVAANYDLVGGSPTVAPTGSGRLKAMTDASGATVNMTYTVDPSVVNAYGGDFRQKIYAQDQDPLVGGSKFTEIRMDSSGRPVQQTDTVGVTTTTEYSPSSPLPLPIKQTTIVGAIDTPAQILAGTGDDLVTTSGYYANGLLKEQVDPQGNKTLYRYDLTTGQITSSVDPQGNGSFYSYTSSRPDLVYALPTRSNVRTTGDGVTSSQFSYDPKGNVTAIVSPGRRPEVPVGLVWPERSMYPAGAIGDDQFNNAYNNAYGSWVYADQRANSGELDGPITKLGYNQFGDLITSTDADNNVRTIARDAAGNQTGTSFTWTDPNNPLTTVSVVSNVVVNPNDKPTSSSSTVGGVAQPSTQTFYDAFGRAWKTIDANGLESQTTYDKRGLVIQTRSQSRDATNALVWNVSKTVYDSNGRATYTADSVLEGTAVADIYGSQTIYNAAGQVTSTKRLKGVDIQIVAQVSQLSNVPTVVSTSTTTYDTNNRVTESTDAFGKKSQTFYDKFGQTVESRSETRSAALDASGGTTSDQWLVTRTVYDSSGRAIFTSDPYTVTTATALGPTAGNGPALFGSRTFYDEKGRSYKSTRVSGAVVGYNANGNQTLLINEGTEISSSLTEYDNKNRAYKQTSSDGQISITEYDSRDRAVATLGHAVDSALVGLGTTYAGKKVRLRSETVYNQYGQAYRSISNIIDVVNATTLAVESTDRTNQRITEQVYDAQGRVIKTIQLATTANAVFTQREYDTFGRVKAEIDQLGARKDFTYDTSGRLIKVELPSVPNPLNANTPTRPTYQYQYNQRGQMTKLTDANNNITNFGFDVNGLATSRTLPSGAVETTSYDNRQRAILSVSFEGVYKRFVYDDSIVGGGRMLRTEIFANVTDYNNFMNGGLANGNLVAGKKWERIVYRYDAFGRNVSTAHIYADGATTGNPATVVITDTWSMVYDAQGRVIQESSPTGVIGYEYDLLGRKTRTWSGNVGATSTTALSDITYTYDALGRMATVNTVKRDGAVVDSNGATTGTPPETTAYYFDILGRPDYTVMPNEVVEDFTFDNLDRLDVMRHLQSDSNNANLTDNAIRDIFDYGYRADNKRTTLSETFKLNGVDRTTNYTWGYDAAGRLASEALDHWDNTFDQTESYIYDLVGNRTLKTVDKSGTTNDQTFKYNYDSNDRLTSETRHNDLTGTAASNQTTAYTWNATQQSFKTVTESSVNLTVQNMVYGLGGQLEQVTTETRNTSNILQSRLRVDYRYDTAGIRFIAIDSTDSNLGTPAFDSVQAGRTEYLIDHMTMTGYGQTIVETKYNSSNQATQRSSYTFGADEITQTVSDLNPSSGIVTATNTYTFGHDGHGSVRALVGAAAAFAQVYTYTAYGELLAIHNGATAAIVSGSASALALPSAASTSMLYNGEGIDSRTGLYNFRARWYSASNARFERLDPFAGNPNDPFSFNKYGFVHGDPVSGTDPSGEIAIFALLGILALVSFAAAIYIPAAGSALDHAYYEGNDGTKENLILATFQGKRTWDGWKRTVNSFVDAGAAGAINSLDTLTFRHVKPLHEYREHLWQIADLENTWIGYTSNTMSWIGTFSGYAASATWIWSAAGGGTMSFAFERAGAPFFVHVSYGSNGIWQHAVMGTGISGLGGMTIYQRSAGFVQGIRLDSIPVWRPDRVTANAEYAFSCVTAALKAFGRGWGL